MFPAAGASDSWVSWPPYCRPFKLTQQPAIFIPFGFSENGLPIGVQLVAARFRDDLVLGIADAVCRAYPTRLVAEPATSAIAGRGHSSWIRT